MLSSGNPNIIITVQSSTFRIIENVLNINGFFSV